MSKYVYLNKNHYIFRIKGENIGRYESKEEAERARDAYLRGDRNLCRYGGTKWRQFLKEMAEHATYLTNQFKDGKLPAGEYFVSREGDNNIFLDFLFEDGKFGSYDDIDRVYMVMPTYEEIVTCMFKSHISQQ